MRTTRAHRAVALLAMQSALCENRGVTPSTQPRPIHERAIADLRYIRAAVENAGAFTAVLVGNITIMRRLAPTSLTAAGFAAGLLAGGAGAWVYAFHCTESGLPFITLWYSAGILATALLGALIGRWLLRW